MPFVKPPTVIGLEAPDAVAPPGAAVTVYDVIGDPFADGALNDTLARPGPAVADTPVGVPGTPAGVTAFVAADAEPVPRLLVAVTVNV